MGLCTSLGHFSPNKLWIYSGESKDMLTVTFCWNAEKALHKSIPEKYWQSIGTVDNEICGSATKDVWE